MLSKFRKPLTPFEKIVEQSEKIEEQWTFYPLEKKSSHEMINEVIQSITALIQLHDELKKLIQPNRHDVESEALAYFKSQAAACLTSDIKDFKSIIHVLRQPNTSWNFENAIFYLKSFNCTAQHYLDTTKTIYLKLPKDIADLGRTHRELTKNTYTVLEANRSALLKHPESEKYLHKHFSKVLEQITIEYSEEKGLPIFGFAYHLPEDFDRFYNAFNKQFKAVSASLTDMTSYTSLDPSCQHFCEDALKLESKIEDAIAIYPTLMDLFKQSLERELRDKHDYERVLERTCLNYDLLDECYALSDELIKFSDTIDALQEQLANIRPQRVDETASMTDPMEIEPIEVELNKTRTNVSTLPTTTQAPLVFSSLAQNKKALSSDVTLDNKISRLFECDETTFKYTDLIKLAKALKASITHGSGSRRKIKFAGETLHFHQRHGRDRSKFVDPKVVITLKKSLQALGISPDTRNEQDAVIRKKRRQSQK